MWVWRNGNALDLGKEFPSIRAMLKKLPFRNLVLHRWQAGSTPATRINDIEPKWRGVWLQPILKQVRFLLMSFVIKMYANVSLYSKTYGDVNAESGIALVYYLLKIV